MSFIPPPRAQRKGMFTNLVRAFLVRVCRGRLRSRVEQHEVLLMQALLFPALRQNREGRGTPHLRRFKGWATRRAIFFARDDRGGDGGRTKYIDPSTSETDSRANRSPALRMTNVQGECYCSAEALLHPRTRKPRGSGDSGFSTRNQNHHPPLRAHPLAKIAT